MVASHVRGKVRASLQNFSGSLSNRRHGLKACTKRAYQGTHLHVKLRPVLSRFGQSLKRKRNEAHDAKGFQLASHTKLELSHSNMACSHKSLGAKYQISEWSVRQHISSMAEFYLSVTDLLLAEMERELDGPTPPHIESASWMDAFDGTGQKVGVTLQTSSKLTLGRGTRLKPIMDASGESPPIVSRGSKARARTTVEVIAGRQLAQWKIRGRKPTNLEIIDSPCGVPSSAARYVWYAWRGTKGKARILAFKRKLLNRAVECGALVTDFCLTDGASADDLFHAATCMVDPASWGKQHSLCMSHQNHHCLMAMVMAVMGGTLMSYCFSIAVFIGMGTHLLRISMSIKHFLARDGYFVVTTSPPSDLDCTLARELIATMLQHHRL